MAGVLEQRKRNFCKQTLRSPLCSPLPLPCLTPPPAVDNGIPIESWYDDEGDSELRDLLPLLEQMAASDCDDVRPLLRQRFRLRERVAAAAAAWAARAEQEEAWQAAAVGGSGDGGSDGMMTQAVRSAAAAAAAMQPA